MIKNLIKKNISTTSLERLKTIREIFYIFPNYLSDAIKYIRHSATFKTSNKYNLQAMLIKNAHIIEKGLSMPRPRPGYGKPVIKKLINQIERYLKEHSDEEIIYQAVSALDAYLSFNREYDLLLPAISEKLDSIRLLLDPSKLKEHCGGRIKVRKRDLLCNSATNFSDLTSTRYSIRNFAPEPVDLELIKKAADISRKTPSVCNRQTTTLFLYSKDKMPPILNLQNGNRGFGDTASHLAIVTSNLNCFTGLGERNQAYVDGGLMAMSFVYALHSLGVGTCFLNWSVTHEIDRKLKKVALIPDSHVVITLIAIGNIPEELNLAASPRMSLDHILKISN